MASKTALNNLLKQGVTSPEQAYSDVMSASDPTAPMHPVAQPDITAQVPIEQPVPDQSEQPPVVEKKILPDQGFTPDFVPQTAPQGGITGTILGEAEAGISPDWWGKTSEALKQLSEELPVGLPGAGPEHPGAWTRMLAEKSYESDLIASGHKRISADEANKRLPGNNFKDEIFPEIAQLHNDWRIKREKDQNYIDRGPETGMLFGLGIGAASSLDPVNALSGILTGGAARAVGVAESFTASVGENFIGNLLGDVPSYIQRSGEGEDVSLPGTIFQAGAGAVAGAALHKGVKVALNKAKLRFESKSPAIQEKEVKAVIVQHENGEKIDLHTTQVTEDLRNSGAVNPKSPPNPHVYTEIDHPSKQPMFQGLEPGDKPTVLNTEFGTEGVHAVSDQAVVNNRIAPPEATIHGEIQQLEVSTKAKVLNIEQSLAEVKGKVATAIKKIVSKLEIPTLDEGMTIREFMHKLSTEYDVPPREINDIMKKAGFDGYHFVDSLNGEPARNGVFMFDDSKVTKVDKVAGNSEHVPNPHGHERAQRERVSQSTEAAKDHTPERQRETAKKAATPPPELTEVDKAVADIKDTHEKALNDLAVDNPALQKVVKEISDLKKDDVKEAGAVQKLIGCLIGDIT